MNQNKALLALDVGEKRIGVAASDGIVTIARSIGVVEVDGSEIDQLRKLIEQERSTAIIVGYPRNQSGEATAQTSYVESFAKRLKEAVTIPVLFQDESLTSVLAEDRLRSHGRPYTKGDVDAQAATIILQDYLEKN